MKHFILIGILSLAFIIVSAGCSGTNPVGINPQDTQSAKTADPASGNRVFWGLWNCYLGPDGKSIEVQPLRTAAFTANVTKILESSPGNLTFQNVDLSRLLSEGRLDCTITLKHPFPGLGRYDGFDVWGVLMTNGVNHLNYDNLFYTDGIAAASIINADGYTRWFNKPEFGGNTIPLVEYYPGKMSNLADPTATLNPYRIFADGLAAEDDYHQWIASPGNANNRGIFTAGSANSRRYQLQFPMESGHPVVQFQYAVVASWEPGDPTLTGDPALYDPGDFPSSANVDEPFFVNASTAGSDLFYVDPGSLGGAFKADVEVFDWQGGSVGGNGVPNEINRMIIESDFIPTGSHEFSQTDLASVAQPSTVISSVFQIEIPSCTPQKSGPTGFWVIVESAGQKGASYGQGFPTAYPSTARRTAFINSSVDVSGQVDQITVTSIDPNHAPFFSMVTGAKVSGTGFKNSATIELRKSGQPSVAGTNVSFISNTELTCDFDLKGADSGLWDVAVINPDLQEGTLAAGFTIDKWSEETDIADGSFRIPALTERASGQIILAFGSNDVTCKYMIFNPLTTGWEGPYLLNSRQDNAIINSLATNPVDDTVYFLSDARPYYRYQNGTGIWEGEEDPDGDKYPVGYDPIAWCRTAFVVADNKGRTHTLMNSSDAFGWLIHSRAKGWDTPLDFWDYTYDLFNDGFNDEIFTEGGIYDFDASGNIWVVYVKDAALNPYQPNPGGARFIKIAEIPNADPGYSSGFYEVEQATGSLNALDSPAIAIDPNGKFHVAYRKYDSNTSMWKIGYEYSTNQGQTWTPGADIFSGGNQIDNGYVFLLSDSQGGLHAVYVSDQFIEYKESTDGLTWSDAEIPDPDGNMLPLGYGDMMPEVMVTAGDILDIAWIRGNEQGGYGSVYHRMRDLL